MANTYGEFGVTDLMYEAVGDTQLDKLKQFDELELKKAENTSDANVNKLEAFKLSGQLDQQEQHVQKTDDQEQHRCKEKRVIAALWLAVIGLLLGVIALCIAYSITTTELQRDVDNLVEQEMSSSRTLQELNVSLQNSFKELVETQISQLSSQLETQISQLGSQFLLNLSSLENSFREQVEQNNESIANIETRLSQELQPSINIISQQHDVLARYVIPAASCSALPRTSPSGYYFVETANNASVEVYCNMSLSCGDVAGGWTQVARLNMSNSSQ